MRVTTTGQVTIPAEIMEQFGFLPDTEVEFVVQGDAVSLRPSSPSRRPGANTWSLACAAVRAARSTTDDILALTRHG